MKRKTFYYISLSLPYIALLASVIFAYANGFSFWEDPPSSVPFLAKLILFFTFASIIWVPLYTWLVAVMLFWGRGRSANEIRRMYLFAPVLLGCSTGLPVLVIDIRNSMLLLFWGFLRLANLDFIRHIFFEKYSLEEPFTVGLVWALMAVVCLVVGYMFVGIVLLIERGMLQLHLFAAEENIPSLAEGAKLWHSL